MSSAAPELAEKSDQSRKCENCENDYKYKCPACSVKSCSLECVNSHKSKTGCVGDGIKKHIERNITISQYSGDDMWRDFHFLEDMRRRVLNASRVQEKQKPVDSLVEQQSLGVLGSLTRKVGESRRGGGAEERQKLVTVIKESRSLRQSPIPLLKKACSMRKIKISFCPVNEMQIRKNNTSYYNKKDDLLSWKMEFSIYQEGGLVERRCLDSVSERDMVVEVVSKLVDRSRIERVLLLNNFKDESIGLLEEVDINKSFKENLMGKNIIEFPKFKIEVCV